MDHRPEMTENSQLEMDEVDGKLGKKIKAFFGEPPSSLVSGQWKDEIYSMAYENRGQCHIFSHKSFDSSVGCSFIEETELDTKLLHQTFEELGFKVILHEDYVLKDIRKVIAEVNQEDHSKSSCLVCCFLSYGNQTELYAADKSYDIETVLAPFNGSLSLVGKPKIFIFQVKKPNFNVDISGESEDSGVANNLIEKRYYTKKIPFFADFLIALSTFSGSNAFTNGQRCSNFILLLCHALRKHSKTLDFLLILTLVNSEMVRLFKSCPLLDENFHFRSCLTRMLKFT